MGMKDFLVTKGFHFEDESNHFRVDDDSFIDLLKEEVIPMLADKSNWPFFLLVMNADTHMPFTIGSLCNDFLLAHGYPLTHRSFTCLDKHLEIFTETIKAHGLDMNTEFLVFGDHPTMGWEESLGMTERNLTILLPLRPQDDSSTRALRKSLTYYDHPPTVLNLLGIDASPPFPFGADIFGEKEGAFPGPDDLQIMYEAMAGSTKFARCRRAKGLCQGNEN